MSHWKSHAKAIGVLGLTLVLLFFLFQNCGQEFRALTPDDEPNTLLPTDPVDGGGGPTAVPGEPPVIPPAPPVVAGAPDAPNNFRVLLVGNDWAEFQWDDVLDDSNQPMEHFFIYRDGINIRRVSRQYDSNDQRERERYWKTKTLIDCNRNRFDCSQQQPEPGRTYRYEVTAVDAQGRESARSNTLNVTYHGTEGTRLNREDLNDFEVVFEDNFNGSELSDQWVLRRPWDAPGANAPDQLIINDELQYMVDIKSNPTFGYNPFQMFSRGGVNGVSIRGIRTPENLRDSKAQGQPYLSGLMSTRESFNFKYGFVEARLKPSATNGTLSTFFLLNSSYHLGGPFQQGHPEIDIFEFLGRTPFAYYQAYHYQSTTHDIELLTHSSPTLSFQFGGDTEFDDGFHTYSVLWEPELVIWYVDDVEVTRLTGPNVSSEDMYVVFSLVIGSEWAGRPTVDTVFPTSFEIDYVKVLQRR